MSRLEKQITPAEREKFAELAGSKSINQVVHDLLDAFNPDRIEEEARKQFDLPDTKLPNKSQKQAAQKALIKQAASTFNGKLNTYIEIVRKSYEQIIDVVNIDKVQFAGWGKQAREKAEDTVRSFSEFIETHKDEITALRIFYSQPYRRRELTYKMIKEVQDILKRERPNLAPLYVWQAYEQLEQVNGSSPKSDLTALVALIRRVTGADPVLTSFENIVNRNFQKWVFEKQAGALKFNEEQMAWLRMIKDHVVSSVHLGRDDLDYAPFDAQGGVGRMVQLFGDQMDEIIEEMNEALAA